MAVGLPAPRAPPVLELDQFLGCFLHESLDGVLIAEPGATTDRIVRVRFQAVLWTDRSRSAPLGSASVAAHRVHFRDDRDAEARVRFGHGNRRAQARPSASDQ